jgi:hypothetical protein
MTGVVDGVRRVCLGADKLVVVIVAARIVELALATIDGGIGDAGLEADTLLFVKADTKSGEYGISSATTASSPAATFTCNAPGSGRCCGK